MVRNSCSVNNDFQNVDESLVPVLMTFLIIDDSETILADPEFDTADTSS